MFSSFEMKRFGKKLRKVRVECDMTQAEVAKVCTVSIDTLRRIENGHGIPRYVTLVSLTNVYQKDLLKLFDSYTEDLNLLSYYNQIDEAILENDLSIAKTLYDELVSEVITEDVEKNQVDLINYKQILCFLETRQMFYDKRHEVKNTIEHNIIEALKLRIYDFQLDKFEKYNYTHVELRLLLLLAINYKPQNQLKSKMLIFLNSMLIENNFEKYNMELRLKILYHLSYTAFQLEDDTQAIQWASEGITLAIEKKTGYLLPYLYTRRATSKHFLKEDYSKDVSSSLFAIELFYDEKLKKEFLSIYETHGMKV